MLFGETELTITMDTSAYETATGFDISTNTDLIFMLKADRLDADIDACYSVTAGADLSFASNVLTAKINDWSGLTVGPAFYMGWGFKLSGDANYREIPIDDDDESSLVFTQDTIRG